MSIQMNNASASDFGQERKRQNFKIKAEPFLYLSPSIILICLVIFVPLVIGISYSFQSISLFNMNESKWIGFDQFEAIYRDKKFYKALSNTFWWTFGSVIFQFFLGLGLVTHITTRF